MQFVAGSNAFAPNAVVSATLPVPAGAQAGDLCLVVLSTDSSGAATAAATGFTRYLLVGASGTMYTDIIGRIWDGSAGPITVSHGGGGRSITLTGLWFRGAQLAKFGTVGIRSGTVFTVTAPGIGTVPNGASVWALFGERTIAANAAEQSENVTLTWGTKRYFGTGNPALSATSGISTAVLVQGSGTDTGNNTATFADSSGNAWGVVVALIPRTVSVWDGSKEIPATSAVWNGSVEVPAAMEVV